MKSNKSSKLRDSWQVGESYRPYYDRFKNHPYAIPVAGFLILFFLFLASLIGLNGKTLSPSDSHIVKLSLDDSHQTLPTRAKTVGEFIDRAEIKLAENDIVEPDKDTQIVSDNFKINVYRARPVTIEDNGNLVSAYSAATTPRSVAKQAGLEVHPEDKVEFQLPESVLREGVLGEKVVIQRSVPANLNLYGAHIALRTHAKTVAELLKEKNVVLEQNDTVQPALETPITPNIGVFVLRNGVQVATVEETIGMPVEIIEDPSLSFGAQAIRQQGSPGKKTVTYEITLENNVEKSRRKIQEVITLQPVKQIVARGPQGSFGQALHLLRQCEAGGNYAINTGNGYYGAYQFNVSTWNGYGGFTYPSDAPPAVQDQKATETYMRRGWQPWPGCTAKLGLQDVYR